MIFVVNRPEGMADLQVYVRDERGVFYVATEVDAEIARLKEQRDESERIYTEMREAKSDGDFEIARLTADLARVRGQRDRLAIDMKHSIHADRLFCGSSDAKRESAEIMESEYGLRIESGEVKEIEG